MPLQVASDIANIAAPANLDLARIEPSTSPKNWPCFDSDDFIDEAMSSEAMDEIFSLLLSVQATEMVVAANGHVYQSKKRWIEAEYLCGLSEDNSSVNPGDYLKALRFWKHFMPALRLPRMVMAHLIKSYGKKVNIKISPIAIRLFPGKFAWPRSHILMITRGLYAPFPELFGGEVQCCVRENYFAYEVNGKPIGRLIYWYNPWSSSHPVNAGGSIGTALLIQKDVLENLQKKTNDKLVACSQITRHYRYDDYKEWQSETATNYVQQP